MDLEWSLGNVAWLLGAFVLALAPAALLLSPRHRRRDRGSGCRRRRYRPD